MPEVRAAGTPPIVRRSPPRPSEPMPPSRRAEIVEVFARVLPGVVVTPATFRSETALAGQLRVETRRIRDLRLAGLVAPTRLGRGWVYGPRDVRVLSVMLGLLRLGATVHELGVFFDAAERLATPPGTAAPDPLRLAIGFCERLTARMEGEIGRLAALDALLAEPPATDVLQPSGS